MKSTNIAELSPNDGWQFAVRKINANFNSIFRAIENNSSIKLEASSSSVNSRLENLEANISKDITDLRDDITTAISEFNEDIEEFRSAIDEFREEFDSMSEQIEELKLASIPPVGTSITCDYDPNDMWPETTWVRIGSADYEDDSIWKRME